MSAILKVYFRPEQLSCKVNDYYYMPFLWETDFAIKINEVMIVITNVENLLQ